MRSIYTPRTGCSLPSIAASLTRDADGNHDPRRRPALPRHHALLCLVVTACSPSAPAHDAHTDTVPAQLPDSVPAPLSDTVPAVLPDTVPAASPDPPSGQDTVQIPHVDSADTYFEGSEVVWLEARERGVTFRAIGQEPGWLVEIEGDRQIRVVTNYGADEVVTPVPPAVVDSITWTTTYRAVTESDDLRIDIRDEPCADTMSGELFSATVSMVLNGTTYHGCGRALDELL
jgi:uncharacterized membrane protein